jgi:hypothetical protein
MLTEVSLGSSDVCVEERHPAATARTEQRVRMR